MPRFALRPIDRAPSRGAATPAAPSPIVRIRCGRAAEAQRTSQGDLPAIEIVVVEIETADGIVGVGECLARRGAAAYAALHRGGAGAAADRPGARSTGAASGRAMRAVLTGRPGGMLVEAIAGDRHRALGHRRQGCRRSRSHSCSAAWAARAIAGLCLVDQLARRRDGRAARSAAAFAAGFRRSRSRSACRSRPRSSARASCAGSPATTIALERRCQLGLRRRRCDRASAARSPISATSGSRSRSVPRTARGYRDAARAAADPARRRRERLLSRATRSSCIGDRSIGLIQPDVARSGGITETWRIAELAHSFNVAYAPHVGWSGAICVAASLQLAAAAENCVTFECMVYANPLREALLKHAGRRAGQPRRRRSCRCRMGLASASRSTAQRSPPTGSRVDHDGCGGGARQPAGAALRRCRRCCCWPPSSSFRRSMCSGCRSRPRPSARAASFVGLANYAKILADPYFWRALGQHRRRRARGRACRAGARPRRWRCCSPTGVPLRKLMIAVRACALCGQRGRRGRDVALPVRPRCRR